MKELPKKWDMFYLLAYNYGRYLENDPTKEHIVRENYSVINSTYVVNASMYDALLEQLDKIDRDDIPLPAVDHLFAKMHSSMRCYGTYEPLAYQTGDPSNISGLDRQENLLFQPRTPKNFA